MVSIKDLKDIKSILVIKPDRFGDMVLTSAVLTAIRDRFPDSRIALLTRRYVIDIIEGHPALDEIIIDRLNEKNLNGQKISPREFFAVVRELREKKFDLSVDFIGDPLYAGVAFLAGIKYRIGEASRLPVGLLFNVKYFKNVSDYSMHEVEHMLKMIGVPEADFQKYKSVITIKEEHLKATRERLSGLGIRPDDLTVGISVGAGGTTNKLLPEMLQELSELLVKRYGAKVLLLGGAVDKKTTQMIAEKVKGAYDLTAATWGETSAIMKMCKYHIGADTGATHLAAAFNIPLIVVFSAASIPTQWGPWGGVRQIVLKKPGGITAEEMAEAFGKLLNGGGTEGYEGTREQWIKLSLNILIVPQEQNEAGAKKVFDSLRSGGYNAYYYDGAKKLLDVFREKDINVCHFVAPSLSADMRLLKFFHGMVLPRPVVFVSGARDFAGLSDIISGYLARMRG